MSAARSVPMQTPRPAPASSTTPDAANALGSGTYEVIRQRLQAQGDRLREQVRLLNRQRQEVFGSVEAKLLRSDRITTTHNCLPRDIVPVGGGRFLFGFNVHLGLKQELSPTDVFAIFERDPETGSFRERPLDLVEDKAFVTDFKRLHQVYEKATFSKFSIVDGSLYAVFRIGSGLDDVAVFKWTWIRDALRYVDGRSESEYRKLGFPPSHEFRWLTPDRNSFRYGTHPHVSIEDRVFVECIGGTLTIKVEDNTATGEGVYEEPVEELNQKVDDAEIGYAIVGHLIVLKVRPYKEKAVRHFVFNEKSQTVVRVDSIGQSCALLPESHGLVFPDGYYLETGELKRFEGGEGHFTLERVLHAPNGEDSLYVFYNRMDGTYVLLPYRLIEQRIEERITCHGFSLFPDGQMVLFRAESDPQKHHTIQLRQTPFHQPGHEPAGRRDAFLYQVGNRDVVRCLAECNEILTLIGRPQPYAELYADVVRRCDTVLDSYVWARSVEGIELAAALQGVRTTAETAVEEFDKVRRLQREAAQRVTEARKRVGERFQTIRRSGFRTLDEYVQNLGALRQLRGELITLKEVRYADIAALAETEAAVAAQAEELGRRCVAFLLQPTALDLHRKRAAQLVTAVDSVSRSIEGRKLEQEIAGCGRELELLTDIVNSLRIDDATEATRVVDSITAIFAVLNQARAALKNRLQNLGSAESAAQFAAQMKLVSQTAASHLDVADTPAKCEEYLSRIGVQLEEMEGAFADFEDFIVQIAEKRTALYEAFEQRKLALVEQRNRKTAALFTAAERVLKAIHNRLGTLQTAEQINAYMASDVMIAKVREISAHLLGLEDSVKADDLQSRLKTAHQEAVRQLKDRNELFVDGAAVIQLGRHRFNTNTQPLDLTVVQREDRPCFHLTSTKYFEPIADEGFLATREAWDQTVVSETPAVYRAEYLALRLLESLEAGGQLADAAGRPAAQQLAQIQEFMAGRHDEGYTKGVHDEDAARIFALLASSHVGLQMARYRADARACGLVFWHRFCPADVRTLWTAKLEGFAARNRLFSADPRSEKYISGLRGLLRRFVADTNLFDAEQAAIAGEYLFFELTSGPGFSLTQEAENLIRTFDRSLTQKGAESEFRQARAALATDAASEFELVRDWVAGVSQTQSGAARVIDEAVAFVFCGPSVQRKVVVTQSVRTIEGMKGNHPLIVQGRYEFDYLHCRERLARHDRDVVPRFTTYSRLKQSLLQQERARLRLDEFKPRVLTSFVRNQLIDEVYLPLIGDNLAKQIGAAGAAKRTDLMGLLLLISPPGYGKTTLLEYVAARLGLVFVKINGPALGHGVSSLDPEEASNASAREELNRLNLAFEMGDNVMLCIDDIQHCSAEFLQRFISLCDGQRKIEGVWRGKPRTYDLRGRKVVVVMAGNPYTESGQKFKIPDMLANRADTYNLGDIIGGSAEAFKASYLENAITSNAVLAPLANKSQKDVRALIRMATTGDRDLESLEASYTGPEIEEILAVLTRLVSVRDVVLRVNQEYIHSAAQSDDFRTEPPFRLQGSYRNMNRLAEKIVPVMNESEVRAAILEHYRGESQTLTTGAEANFLKFKELIGAQNPEEKARWDEIKTTFRRHQLVRGTDQNDPVGRLVGQLTGFHAALQSIQQTLDSRLGGSAAIKVDLTPLTQSLDALRLGLQDFRPGPGPDSGRDTTAKAPVTAALLRKTLKAIPSERRAATGSTSTPPPRPEIEHPEEPTSGA